MIRGCLFILLLSSTSQASLKSSGSAGTFFKQYSFQSTSEYSSQSAGLNGSFKLDWKANRQWRWRTDLEIFSDLASRDSSEKFQGNPRSFYLENKSSPVTLRAGYQTIVPDGPDILNPADIIHSKNWIDPTAPKSLASAGLSLSQEVEEWQWEIFYIPQQTKPVLPGEKSPWWPREKRLPIESADTEIQIPNDVQYRIKDGEEIDQALKNNYAFRLQRKSESFEAQLVYSEGLAQDPYLKIDGAILVPISLLPKQIFSVESPVPLKPIYYRRQAVAGTFLIPIQNWVLKGGANWMKPKGTDTNLPKESSTAVLGVERNFETRRGVVTWILQHEAQQKLEKDQISFMRSIFEKSWSLGLRVPWGEELQFLGGVIYDSVGKSSIYRLSASRRLGDSFSVELGGTVLEGPEETMLGLYNKYDNWNLNLNYHF